MGYDEDKVDEAVLALLHLNVWEENEWAARAWKSMPWEATDRLYEKGLIGDPKSKAKSVALTEEGKRAAEEAFRRVFARRGQRGRRMRCDERNTGPRHARREGERGRSRRIMRRRGRFVKTTGDRANGQDADALVGGDRPEPDRPVKPPCHYLCRLDDAQGAGDGFETSAAGDCSWRAARRSSITKGLWKSL